MVGVWVEIEVAVQASLSDILRPQEGECRKRSLAGGVVSIIKTEGEKNQIIGAVLTDWLFSL